MHRSQTPPIRSSYTLPLPGLQAGRTSLIAASICGNLEVVKVLLDIGVDLEAKDKVSSGLSKEVGCRG